MSYVSSGKCVIIISSNITSSPFSLSFQDSDYTFVYPVLFKHLGAYESPGEFLLTNAGSDSRGQ